MLKRKLFALALCLIAMPLIAQDDEVDVQELMQDAASHLQSQEFGKAADVFAKIVKAAPDNGRAWHLYGYALHGAGKLDEAIKIHEKATKFEQFKGISLYNLGCAYSLKENNDKAFEYLNKAVSAGYKDLSQYESDSDLENVRSDKRFKRIVARIKGTDKEMDKDKKSPNLAGTWNMKSGMRGGEKSTNMPPSIKVTKETFTIPTPDPTQKFVMAYELDSSQKPMQIDFEIKSGPAPEGGKAKGIVKLDKGKMTLCYDPTGSERPDSFKSTEENGFFLFELQRVPRKLTAKRVAGTWDIVSGSRSGKEVGAERLKTEGGVKFTEEEITLPAGPGMVFEMKYKINNETRPAQIDMEIVKGPAPEGAKALGIVKIQGGNLVVCYDVKGTARPKKFATTEEDEYFMFTLKRKAANKKKADKSDRKDSDK